MLLLQALRSASDPLVGKPHDVREELGERWTEMILECARYASESRQPWSEPPMMTPPQIDPAQPMDGDELRAAMAGRDRLVNAFFGNLYGRTSDYLARSPSFRAANW